MFDFFSVFQFVFGFMVCLFFFGGVVFGFFVVFVLLVLIGGSPERKHIFG